MNQSRKLQYSGICQMFVMTMFLFFGIFCFHNLSVQASETDAPQIKVKKLEDNGKEGLEQRVTASIYILNYVNKKYYPYEYRVVGTDTWKELDYEWIEAAEDDPEETSGYLDWAEAKDLRYGDRVEVRAKIGDTYTKSGYFKVLTDEVLNGNFEVTKSGNSLKEREDIYGWRTTNPEGTIGVSSDGSAYNLKGARRGKNFAVLDSSKDEALYQEIKVTPGQKLNWSLSHAAYNGEGKIIVIIGPSLSDSESYNDKDTSGLNLFQQVERKFREKPEGVYKEQIINEKKYNIIVMKGNKEKWKDRSCQYIVPEEKKEIVFAILPVGDESRKENSKIIIDDVEVEKGAEVHVGYINKGIKLAIWLENISEDKEGTVYALLNKDNKIIHNWTEKKKVDWSDLPLDGAPYIVLKSLDEENLPDKDRDKQVAFVNATVYKGNHVIWSSNKGEELKNGESYCTVQNLTNCLYNSDIVRYFKPAAGYSWNGKIPQVTDENSNAQEVEIVDKEKEIYSIRYKIPDTPGSARIVEEPTLNMKVNGIKENDSYKGKTSFSIEGVTNPDKVTVKANDTQLERQKDGTYVLWPSADSYTVTATDEYGNTLEVKNIKVDWLGEVGVPEIESKTYDGQSQAADIWDGQIDGMDYMVTENLGGQDAGTYYVTLKLRNPEYRWKAAENVKVSEDGSEVKVPFVIKKAKPELTPPKGKNLLENGKYQELADPGECEGGTLMYRLLSKDYFSGEWKWAGNWSEKVPKAKEMYREPVCKIYYKVVGDKNHENIEESDESFVEAALRLFEVKWDITGGSGSRGFTVKTSDLSKIKVVIDGKEVEGQDSYDGGKYYCLVPNKDGYSIHISDGYGHDKYEFEMVNWIRVRPPVSASKVYTGTNLKSDLTDGVIEDRVGEMVPANAKYEVIKNDGGTDTGTYDVVLRLKDPVNYKWYVDADSDIKLNEDGTEATVPFTITKAVPEITEIPVAKKLTCTGKPQELVTKGMTTGGMLEYSLDGKNWSEDIPKAVDAGEYTVYYRVNGGMNYEDTEVATVTVLIEKKKEQNKPQQDNTKKNTAQGDIYLNAGLKVTPVGKKINIMWGKVPGATGYDVYVQYCGKKYTADSLYKVKNGKTTKLVVKKLNKKKLDLKKEYRIYVVAYQKNKGKKVILAKTITAHVVGRLHKKATNVKEIKLAKTSYNLKRGTKQAIKAKAVLMNKQKRQLSNKHAREFRFASGNPKVASVSTSGIIKAVGKGSCTVYVYARNGYTKAIKVTVK